MLNVAVQLAVVACSSLLSIFKLCFECQFASMPLVLAILCSNATFYEKFCTHNAQCSCPTGCCCMLVCSEHMQASFRMPVRIHAACACNFVLKRNFLREILHSQCSM